MNTIHCKILTPSGVSFDNEVDAVRMATVDGLLEIFPQHADLVGTIDFSHVWAVQGQHTDHFLVRHGMLSVDSTQNQARIMVFECLKKESVDFKTLRQYFDMLNGLLTSGVHSKMQISFLKGEISSMEKMLAVTENVDSTEARK